MSTQFGSAPPNLFEHLRDDWSVVDIFKSPHGDYLSILKDHAGRFQCYRGPVCYNHDLGMAGDAYEVTLDRMVSDTQDSTDVEACALLARQLYKYDRVECLNILAPFAVEWSSKLYNSKPKVGV